MPAGITYNLYYIPYLGICQYINPYLGIYIKIEVFLYEY
nr:MAG TPA: hypothetical protein [Caudoviricetes sp.]